MLQILWNPETVLSILDVLILYTHVCMHQISEQIFIVFNSFNRWMDLNCFI